MQTQLEPTCHDKRRAELSHQPADRTHPSSAEAPASRISIAESDLIVVEQDAEEIAQQLDLVVEHEARAQRRRAWFAVRADLRRIERAARTGRSGELVVV